MSRSAGRPKKGEVVIIDEQWLNTRAKISHFVARNNIEKKCVICGKEGRIMHNKENPYKITFICSECEKNPENIKKADRLRFDIRNKVPKKGTHILRTSTDEYITEVVENYLKETLPIREYCNMIGISNRQFHVIIDKYKEIYPDRPIADNIKSHRDTVHRHRIAESRRVDI